MPVQTNIGIQVSGVVNDPENGHDIRFYTQFGWTFQVTTDIETDAVFAVECAPPSDDDACAPGEFSAAPEVPLCQQPAFSGQTPEEATITIPEGTLAGTICAGTIPCRCGAFVRLVASSGDTDNVSAVMLLKGPKMGRERNNPYSPID